MSVHNPFKTWMMPNKQPNDIHSGLQRSEASQAQKQTRTEMTEMANKKLICRVN